jgi:hypothetical protein
VDLLERGSLRNTVLGYRPHEYHNILYKEPSHDAASSTHARRHTVAQSGQ